MAKFIVTGADRETGEDVEMVIEAASRDEAASKANRKGVLVANCAAREVANASGQPSASGAACIPRPPSTTTGRRLLRTLAVLVVLAAGAVVALYFTVLRPQSDQIGQTLHAAADQSEKSAAMTQKGMQQQVAQVQRQLGEGAEPAEPDASKSKKSDEAAIRQKADLKRYVETCQPLVAEFKGLRARINSGLTYVQYSDKMQTLTDAFAQVPEQTPAGSAEALKFVAAATTAFEKYREAAKEWKLGIDLPQLKLAQEINCREIWKTADAQLSAALEAFDTMQAKAE